MNLSCTNILYSLLEFFEITFIKIIYVVNISASNNDWYSRVGYNCTYGKQNLWRYFLDIFLPHLWPQCTNVQQSGILALSALFGHLNIYFLSIVFHQSNETQFVSWKYLSFYYISIFRTSNCKIHTRFLGPRKNSFNQFIR